MGACVGARQPLFQTSRRLVPTGNGGSVSETACFTPMPEKPDGSNPTVALISRHPLLRLWLAAGAQIRGRDSIRAGAAR